MNRAAVAQSLLFVAATSCGSSTDKVSTCQSDDADGINGVSGGGVTFDLNVDEITGFSPAILPAQNLTKIALTLHNRGMKPHDFVIDCLPTPNADGCPMTSCFPRSASIPTVAPGAIGVAMFVTPGPEGLYDYHSDLPGDAPTPCTAGALGCGQFQVR